MCVSGIVPTDTEEDFYVCGESPNGKQREMTCRRRGVSFTNRRERGGKRGLVSIDKMFAASERGLIKRIRFIRFGRQGAL